MSRRTADVGAEIVGRLAESVGQDRFVRFFKGNAWITFERGRVVVAAPNGFHADLLSRQFGGQVREAARTVVGNADVEVEWRVDPACVARLRPRTPASAPPPESPPPATDRRRPSAPPARSTRRVRLEDLVVGRPNELAYAAVTRLMAPERRGAELLFIHGGCGLGKTHFLQAAASAAGARRGSRVLYTTAERFVNEFLASLNANGLDGFRRRHRSLDLLCMDDVQFLAGKAKTLEEVLHTLEALEHAGGRVVLSSDAHPAQLGGLGPRMVSRCLAGVVVRLEAPDRPMRLELVRRLATERGLALDHGAVSVIADASNAGPPHAGSVRELQGGVARVEALATLLPEARGESGAVTPALARRALSADRGSRPARPVRIPTIAGVVCRALAVELSDIMGTGRHKRVVLARSLTAWLSRSLTSQSFPEIARALNRRNHSTIVTACQRIGRLIGEDAACDIGPDFDGVRLIDLIERLKGEIAREAG